MKALVNKSEVSEVVTHDVAPLTVNTDAGAYSKLGWLTVLLGIGGFLVWAVTAPLDKGVPLQGTVAAAGNRKAVQHQAGGTVSKILVKDGDTVKAGQVLVRMNDVATGSALEMTRAQYYSASASEARLIAERDGKSVMAFPPALEAVKADPRVATNVALQEQLLSSRRMALENELAGLDANISGLKLQNAGILASRDSKKLQMSLLKEQLDNTRDLVRDGYVARSKQLELERGYAQISGALAEDIGNLGRGERQVIELGLRRTQRQQEYQKEVRSQLTDIQKETAALRSRLVAQEYDMNNVEVRAPVDGVVLNTAVFTEGGVVGPGFRMMDVIPSDEAMVVEGQLPVNLVDRVHPGLKAELIFSAFNANKTPHIPGEIIEVAADRTVDERTGAAYYKVKAKVAPQGVKMMAHLQVRAGMPVEMFVKTGERTMMSYLLKPVFDRSKMALTEE
jgi:protease secretion system membrane fusion protein